ncbi:hypothetical protein L5515_019185 [Caenorhabditis briggsae]|uniref:Secreted protein n=1 Tax=Caenorhabditis briggsae TaxID=6238 RepID=A0AAE9FJ91_CAEBR|nr:hypothetical protein L5515_019185 [Caenorhabditis briggsae]
MYAPKLVAVVVVFAIINSLVDGRPAVSSTKNLINPTLSELSELPTSTKRPHRHRRHHHHHHRHRKIRNRRAFDRFDNGGIFAFSFGRDYIEHWKTRLGRQ